MPEQRTRDAYLVGRTGSWLAATPAQVDKALQQLRGRLHASTITAAKYDNLWRDVDALLDRRLELSRARP